MFILTPPANIFSFFIVGTTINHLKHYRYERKEESS